MPNREDLTDAILQLCDTPHMVEYALGNALQRLDLLQLADAFDHIADHHSLLTDHLRPLVGRAAEVPRAQVCPRCATGDPDVAHIALPGED